MLGFGGVFNGCQTTFLRSIPEKCDVDKVLFWTIIWGMWRPIPLENSVGIHGGEWCQMAFYCKTFPEPRLGRAVANSPPKPSLPQKTPGRICIRRLHQFWFAKTTCSCRAGTPALCGSVRTNVSQIWTIDLQDRIHTWSIFSLGKQVVWICSR